jgi:hypothetical protein
LKRLYFLALIATFSIKAFGQRDQSSLPTASFLYEVSGIVKDSTGQSVIGATVLLTSEKDTLRTATNVDGIFVFKNVRLVSFNLSINALGFASLTKTYVKSAASKRIVLDPIELGMQATMLDEVTVRGTPSIIYKTDTVEYLASDYKVREYANVDELLKKMEGMQVGSNGRLVYQGQEVERARLNGKDYLGGNVAQVIQNLPADMVEKIQIVDDYGEQAKRTGIKDGEPTKVVNITSKADRSIGSIGTVTASGGNEGRYDERIFMQRLNANQQLGVIGSLVNTVNGVANTGFNNSIGEESQPANSSNDVSGGTTTTGGPSFNYRDQWGKLVQVNINYSYAVRNIYSINNSTRQLFSTLGTTNSINKSTGNNDNGTHKASFELEYTPNKGSFLSIKPTYGYTRSTIENDLYSLQSGLQNQSLNANSSIVNSNPTIGGVVLYHYKFIKPGRNISLQIDYNHADYKEGNLNKNNIEYRDVNQNFIKDSLIYRQITRGKLDNSYQTSLQYVEPLGTFSQLEFSSQVNNNIYSNNGITNDIEPDGSHLIIDSLSNRYDYSFRTGRITANYNIDKIKYKLSLGFTAIPSHFESRDIRKSVSTSHNDFHLVPMFRFQYLWSRLHNISLNYVGTSIEPIFSQMQPVPDYTDPQNPVFGNPRLKPSFMHTLITSYNNYVANSRFNLLATIAASIIENQVIANTLQIMQPESHSFLNETYYVNINGNYNVRGNYSVSKQLNDRKYNLSLNGFVYYDYGSAMSNGTKSLVTNWRFNQKLGVRVDPGTWYEVNPFISYDIDKSNNRLPDAFNSDIRTMALTIDGRFYVKTWRVGYSASKNYVRGINSNISKDPLVVNAYIEKSFFRRQNGILRISAFDVFNQNNFINRIVTPTSIIDTETNVLSRYVMLSFTLKLQKWSGVVKRNGKELQRRGDGSFIYEF